MYLSPRFTRPSTHLTEGEQDSLEPSRRLVQTLLQGFVQLNIQLSTLSSLSRFTVHHVIPYLFEQDSLKEDLNLSRLQVGDKDFGTCVGSVRCPGGRLSESEKLSPVRKGRKDFEGTRKRSRLVSREKHTDPLLIKSSDQSPPQTDIEKGVACHSLGVHLDDFRVQPNSRIQRTVHTSHRTRLVRDRSDTRNTWSTTPTRTRASLVQFAENQVGEGSGFVFIGKGGEEVGRVGVVEIGDSASTECSEGFVILRVDFLRESNRVRSDEFHEDFQGLHKQASDQSCFNSQAQRILPR
jgi:hypothetical protein